MTRLQQLGWGINSTTNGHEFSTYVGSPTITTSNPRSGTQAGLVSSFVSGTRQYFEWSYGTANIGAIYTSVYVRFNTLPSAANRFIELNEFSTNVGLVFLAVDGSGNVTLNDVTGTIGSSTTVVTGQYYQFELEQDNTGGAGASTVEARVNGSVFATASNRTITTGSSSIRMGANLNAELQTQGSWQFADMAIDSSAYPGSYKTSTTFAAGPGDSAQWTIGGSSPAATNWQSVKDNPPDDAVTLVSSTTNAQQDFYKFGSTGVGPSDTIQYVAVNSRHANNASTNQMGYEMILIKASGGTQLPSSQVAPNSTTYRNNNNAAGVLNPMIITATDPDGGAWTQTTVNNLQAGPKVTLDASANSILVSLVFIVTSWTPGPVSTTQSGVARIAKALTKTQGAVGRVSKGSTLTQGALARVTKTVTKTQPAIARIQHSYALSQGAIANISPASSAGSKTQTAVARITEAVTKTQPATARVTEQITKTQTAGARIQKSLTLTQPSVARIAKGFTLTQGAVARIAVAATKTQAATARVSNGITKTQGAVARVTNTVTKTQPAVARITESITKNQTAVARVQKALTKTQAAVANIVTGSVVTKTQTATARVQTTPTKTQSAIGRIQVTPTKTQSSVARVAKSFTKTQAATARVSVAATKTQGALARIVNTATKTQGATARITEQITKNQTATARIVNTETKTQAAIARISKSFTKTQTAVARIQVAGAKTQGAVARIAKQLTKTQSATAHIANQSTTTQTAVARISKTGLTKTQSALGRIQKGFSLTQGAVASITTQRYSRGSYVSLPTGNADLTTLFNATDYSNVATIDNIFVDLVNSAGIAVVMWNGFSSDKTKSIELTWTGKTSRAASISPVVLQIFNLTSGLWETLTTNTSAPNGSDFTVVGTQAVSMANYYDLAGYCYARIYQ